MVLAPIVALGAPAMLPVAAGSRLGSGRCVLRHAGLALATGLFLDDLEA
jgi:hypothetical protein